jgi:hypothetical protein
VRLDISLATSKEVKLSAVAISSVADKQHKTRLRFVSGQGVPELDF